MFPTVAEQPVRKTPFVSKLLQHPDHPGTHLLHKGGIFNSKFTSPNLKGIFTGFSLYFSDYLSVCLSVYLYFCLFISLYLFLSLLPIFLPDPSHSSLLSYFLTNKFSIYILDLSISYNHNYGLGRSHDFNLCSIS